MKKALICALALAMLLSLCAGCGEKDNEVYELTLSMHDAVTTPNAVYMQAWADKVAEATDGHVRITIYGSEELSAANDIADSVKAGTVDIGWLYTSYYAGQFPLSDVINLPMQGFGDPIVSTDVLWSLYDEYEQVRDEWSDYKLLMLYGNPGMIFASSDAPITGVADLAGRSVRCPSGAITDVMREWGASPVTIAAPDIYGALEENSISAYIFEPSGITNFSLEKVTRYYTDFQMYDGPFSLIMNKARWDSLPRKYKSIIEGLSGHDASVCAAQAFADAVEVAREDIVAASGEFVTVSAEAEAELRVAADAYAAKWARDMSTDGFDAAAYLARANELAAAGGD